MNLKSLFLSVALLFLLSVGVFANGRPVYASSGKNSPETLRFAITVTQTLVRDKIKYNRSTIGFYDTSNRYVIVADNVFLRDDAVAIGEYPILFFDEKIRYFEVCFVAYIMTNKPDRNLMFAYGYDDKTNVIKSLYSKYNGGYNMSFGISDDPTVLRNLYHTDANNRKQLNITEIRQKVAYNTIKYDLDFEAYLFFLVHQPKCYGGKLNPYLKFGQSAKSSIKQTGSFYADPFVPIFCKGDDLSYAVNKPDVLYDEVPGSKIEVGYMPDYKMQSELGECRTFSLATLLQQYTCLRWKDDIPDCKNPPEDTAISYFGLQTYVSKLGDEANSYSIKKEGRKGIYNVAMEIQRTGCRFILENCRPFDNVVASFSRYGGLEARDIFMKELEDFYESNKSTSVSGKDFGAMVSKINATIGLDLTQERLAKALNKDSFAKFMYVVFFDGCKRELFPCGFTVVPFPIDGVDATEQDIKSKLLLALSRNRPVMLPSLCLSQDMDDECDMLHALVISGYKKVVAGNQVKEVFKVHNSWGKVWQKMNNDGWLDAESILRSLHKGKNPNGKLRFGSASLLWLE